MKKIIKKWLCFCVSICMILSVSTNVLAADSRAYQGLNSKVFATDYLTEEEIQEILNNDSAASYSSVRAAHTVFTLYCNRLRFIF